VIKDFGKFAVGASIEGPQTTIGGRGSLQTSSSTLPAPPVVCTTPLMAPDTTLNRTPDFLVKATLDPGWGHYEVVGILSDFRNRVYPCGNLPLPTFPTATCASATSVAGAFNDSRVGGGGGFTARLPIVAKKWISSAMSRAAMASPATVWPVGRCNGEAGWYALLYSIGCMAGYA